VTPVLPLVSLSDWAMLRPLSAFSLVRVRFCSEDFGRACSNPDVSQAEGIALHCKSSYERNFIMIILAKRALTVVWILKNYSYWLKRALDTVQWTAFVLVLLKLRFLLSGVATEAYKGNIATTGKLRFVSTAV
jgi:hypothetical protein